MPRSEQDTGDAAAVVGCAGGDARALEALYSRHSSSCLSFARSILVDHQHAEDVVQEVFLEVWRHADRFDGRRSSVRAWLMLLTHHKAVDRVRAEGRRKASRLLSEHDQADQRPGPDAQAIAAVLSVQAREALAMLPAASREALVLAYWGGYTQNEIALMTRTPLGTVKTRTRNALTSLSVTLAGGEPAGSRPRESSGHLAERHR